MSVIKTIRKVASWVDSKTMNAEAIKIQFWLLGALILLELVVIGVVCIYWLVLYSKVASNG